MKKLVSSTLALSLLAAPVGVMTSHADAVTISISEETKVKEQNIEKNPVEKKKSHKLRNTLIVGATVAGVVAISVATHKTVSQVCTAAAKPENKGLNAICDANIKVSEKSKQLATQVKAGAETAATFVSNNTKAFYEKCKNLFARNNEETTAAADIAVTTNEEETTDETSEDIEEQSAFEKEGSEEEKTVAEEETADETSEDIEEQSAFEKEGSEEEENTQANA